MEKGRVVIAGLLNNDFEHWKFTHRPLERDGAHRPRERTWVAHSLWEVGELQVSIGDNSSWGSVVKG